MESLEALRSLGLPGWLVSIAAVIFILDRIGVVRWVIEHFSDRREFEQEFTQAEWESRRQDRITQDLRQIQVENQALAIAKENIEWARSDFSIMQRTMEQQVRILEQIRENIRILAGEVARLGDGLKRGEE